jgi:hypothetical protein
MDVEAEADEHYELVDGPNYDLIESHACNARHVVHFAEDGSVEPWDSS